MPFLFFVLAIWKCLSQIFHYFFYVFAIHSAYPAKLFFYSVFRFDYYGVYSHGKGSFFVRLDKSGVIILCFFSAYAIVKAHGRFRNYVFTLVRFLSFGSNVGIVNPFCNLSACFAVSVPLELCSSNFMKYSFVQRGKNFSSP